MKRGGPAGCTDWVLYGNKIIGKTRSPYLDGWEGFPGHEYEEDRSEEEACFSLTGEVLRDLELDTWDSGWHEDDEYEEKQADDSVKDENSNSEDVSPSTVSAASKVGQLSQYLGKF